MQALRPSRSLGSARDHLNWQAVAFVDKWSPDLIADAATQLARVPRARRELHVATAQAAQLLAFGVRPDEPDILWSDCNLECNNGINRLCNLLIGTASLGTYAFGTARIGTGNGSTGVVNTNTDLSAAAGSANRWFQITDSTYPSVATQVVTAKATFATADGNYAWNEWGIDGGGGTSSNAVGTNGASTCALLNRVVPTSLGTKAAGASWAITVTLTQS